MDVNKGERKEGKEEKVYLERRPNRSFREIFGFVFQPLVHDGVAYLQVSFGGLRRITTKELAISCHFFGRHVVDIKNLRHKKN